MQSYDYLIIGHGLAGAILAQELMSRGQNLMVVDEELATSASHIAAGLINPITGHRLNLTDNFARYHKAALRFYSRLERHLGSTIYTSLPQLRLLKNQGQYTAYINRRSQVEYQDLLGQYLANPRPFRNAEFGAVEIHHSGRVNTRRLLALSRSALKQHGAYRALKFDYSSLRQQSGHWCYRQWSAKRVIFCEGYLATQNPWLHDLPFKLSKGEILKVRLNQESKNILNWGHWLAPQPENDEHRLGSTYDWSTQNLDSRESQQLLDGLHTHTHLQAELLGVDVGIRPTTLHRTPFVGGIPQLPGSYCFNGFGSKGCLLIPYYASLLCDHMLDHRPLPSGVGQWR